MFGAARLQCYKKNLPIDTLVVALGADNLGSEVIRRTTKSPGNVRNLLCETEIGNFEMTVSVEQQVLGLQITVDDVHRVQVVESERDLGGVELSNGVGESLRIGLALSQ